jgi:hypothetical protein
MMETVSETFELCFEFMGLIATEDYITFSVRESLKSYIMIPI